MYSGYAVFCQKERKGRCPGCGYAAFGELPRPRLRVAQGGSLVHLVTFGKQAGGLFGGEIAAAERLPKLSLIHI